MKLQPMENYQGGTLPVLNHICSYPPREACLEYTSFLIIIAIQHMKLQPMENYQGGTLPVLNHICSYPPREACL